MSAGMKSGKDKYKRWLSSKQRHISLMENDLGVVKTPNACDLLITEEGARPCYEEDRKMAMMKRGTGSLDIEVPPMPTRFEQSAPFMYADIG